MNVSDATIAQLERFIKKIAQKFPSSEEPVTMTDIHIMLSQDTGELMAFDDNDKEITRCVVDEWINSSAPDFYDIVAGTVRDLLARMHEVADGLCILKPYSFILENDEREHLCELYIADSDIRIIGGDLMNGLDEDLDKFLADLFK
mgnify:FL=1